MSLCLAQGWVQDENNEAEAFLVRQPRAKFHYSEMQQQMLENQFQQTQYVIGAERLHLAELTGLTEERVKVRILLNSVQTRHTGHPKHRVCTSQCALRCSTQNQLTCAETLREVRSWTWRIEFHAALNNPRIATTVRTVSTFACRFGSRTGG